MLKQLNSINYQSLNPKESVCVEAFEKIYKKYYETIFRYALSLWRKKQSTEKITPEMFLKRLSRLSVSNSLKKRSRRE